MEAEAEARLLETFREEFQSFSKSDLEAAVREARRDIEQELQQYQIYQTREVITKHQRNVSGFQETQIDSSDDDGDVGVSSVTNVSEESESVSENIAAEVKEEKSRLSYSLDQLEKIFGDILKSLNVNKNYVAKDSLETERAKKRVKDFTARFGRSLYQTKQNYICLKNVLLRSELSGQAPPVQVSDRLAQLYVSSRSLLSSYLHYIPLSGGHLFPSVLSDALDLILDIGNLTVSAGFSTNNLAGQVRELEELMTERGHGPDIVKLDVLNSLARSTFGKSEQTRPARARKSPRGPAAASGRSIIKPRTNKIFQQRTNIARLRRMKDIEQRDAESDWTAGMASQQKRDDRNALREQLQSSKPQQTPGDMKNILRRLHNLEVIASTDPEMPDKISNRATNPSSTDLDFLVSRLEVIESDFDMIALKYRDKLKPKQKFSTRYDLNDVKFFSSPLKHKKEAVLGQREKENSRVALDKIEAIVNKVTDEILADDLLLC